MTSPHGYEPPEQPGPASPSPWAPPAYPAPNAPGSVPAQPPVTPLSGYTVPSTWTAPAWQTAPRAPGTVTAAAVITYVQATLAILAFVAVIAFTALVTGLYLDGYVWAQSVLALGISVVSIFAARQLQRGQSRDLLLWLTIITIALDVINAIVSVGRVAVGSAASGSSICSLILPVTVLILLLQRPTTEWIDQHRRTPPS